MVAAVVATVVVVVCAESEPAVSVHAIYPQSFHYSQSQSLEEEVLLEVEAGAQGTLTLFVCDRYLNMATTGSGELVCDTALVKDANGEAGVVMRPEGARTLEGLQAVIRHSPQVRR